VSDLPRILIVDDSRMVRASLARHLQGVYDVREEADGEAAWQTLVLDHSIVAVISDLQMPVLDGFGLLERVRSCKLARLRDIPFVLISGEEDQAFLDKAERLGVSDFISKGITAVELKTRLGHLLQFAVTRQHLEEARAQQVQDQETGLFTRKYIELQCAQALSHAFRHHGEASVMVIGFDRYPALVDQVGEAKAADLGVKFARLVGGKIRREDCLGHFAPGRFAIVSPGTSPLACISFADRVRRAVADAVITAGGKRLTLTMSVGVASVPADRVISAGSLLDLAASRMEAAMAAGGNRTDSGDLGKNAPALPLSVNQALEWLRDKRPDMVRPQLPRLGQQVLPLLELLQQEFGVELHLDELTKKLAERQAADPATL
jgi:diguanylate cyclase (GGDEF)-like protein